jgi:hypothetical protein
MLIDKGRTSRKLKGFQPAMYEGIDGKEWLYACLCAMPFHDPDEELAGMQATRRNGAYQEEMALEKSGGSSIFPSM